MSRSLALVAALAAAVGFACGWIARPAPAPAPPVSVGQGVVVGFPAPEGHGSSQLVVERIGRPDGTWEPPLDGPPAPVAADRWYVVLNGTRYVLRPVAPPAIDPKANLSPVDVSSSPPRP